MNYKLSILNYQLVFALLFSLIFASCDDYETYAEKKEDERNAISAYMNSIGANVITEDEFRARVQANPLYSGESNNEWVLLTKSSVYMQVVNLGTFYKEEQPTELQDKIIKSGETKSVLCRFQETNLMTNTMTLSNLYYEMLAIPETMTVTRTSDTFTGVFTAGSSLMYSTYGTTSVPTGWLVPLFYLNIGRCATENDNIAEVKLIVPHSQGHATASSAVNPYLYTITYQEGK